MNDTDYIRRVYQLERRMYRIAYAILWNDADCADAVSEAVFRGWMKKDGLREEAYLETWLIRILINCARDLLKKRSAVPLPEQYEPAGTESVEDGVLREALQKLPDKYRLPLLLHHSEGYSLAEVAAMLKIPEPLVKSRLHQARAALRALLGEEDERS